MYSQKYSYSHFCYEKKSATKIMSTFIPSILFWIWTLINNVLKWGSRSAEILSVTNAAFLKNILKPLFIKMMPHCTEENMTILHRKSFPVCSNNKTVKTDLKPFCDFKDLFKIYGELECVMHSIMYEGTHINYHF